MEKKYKKQIQKARKRLKMAQLTLDTYHESDRSIMYVWAKDEFKKARLGLALLREMYE
jgi:hypothetical protein